MDARAFLEEARTAGFTLAVRGGNLAVTPASRLSDSQRKFIRAHKPAILAALTEKPAASTEGPAAPAAGGSSAPADPARAAVPAGAAPLPRRPTPAELADVGAWLDHIGETDPSIRRHVMDACHADPWALPWYLERAAEPHRHQPATDARPETESAPTGTSEAHAATSGPVCCGDCRHFERDDIGDGTGIGACRAGVPARPGWPARYPLAERHCRGFAAIGGIPMHTPTNEEPK